jgi:hypothetical protein
VVLFPGAREENVSFLMRVDGDIHLSKTRNLMRSAKPTQSFMAAAGIVVLGLSVSLACSKAKPQAAADFDVIIAQGRIVDGTGSPWFRADLGIRGDRITALGDLSAASAAARIDASGLVVAPGFIDMLGQSEFNLLVDNRAASKILQGVTT